MDTYIKSTGVIAYAFIYKIPREHKLPLLPDWCGSSTPKTPEYQPINKEPTGGPPSPKKALLF
jgi:hypothetical protein